MFHCLTSLRSILLCAFLVSWPSVTTLARDIICFEAGSSRTSKADCLQALAKIPSGNLDYQGDSPPSFRLPESARPPKRCFPNVFDVGTCEIAIRRIGPPPGPPPVYTAHVMYFDVWPAFKAAAQDIMNTCVPERGRPEFGRTIESVVIEGRSWNFEVMVWDISRIRVCGL